ncbi:unnamed protein product [Calicophoron daubneyi]|uniref:Uncharacterized protein n=1 Tax=Calicophoron daubneyi TaxID=300641 RepID=A0AAV2TBD5_CALDB
MTPGDELINPAVCKNDEIDCIFSALLDTERRTGPAAELLTMYNLRLIFFVLSLTLVYKHQTVEGAVYIVPLEFDLEGRAYIEHDNQRYYNDRDEELTLEKDDCRWSLFLQAPTEEEIATRTGHRSIGVLCESQFPVEWETNAE